MLTVICNTNTTACAVCPTTVNIILPDGPPYTDGNEMTCSSDGYPAATYEWTVDGVAGSAASTQALEEGDHEYVCTATVTLQNGMTCNEAETVTLTAYSKCQKAYDTRVATLILIALSAG